MTDKLNFDLKGTDRRFYAERIERFLPERIFDAHRHIGRAEDIRPISPERMAGNWAMEVARYETLDHARRAYSELLPGRESCFLAIGWPFRECHLDANNQYIADGIDGEGEVGLALSDPAWPAEKVADTLRQPGIIGLKSYADLTPPIEGRECGIFDFFIHEHLEVLNAFGGWMTLHIPRAERLAAPENISEIHEIRKRYPDIVLVIAHLGRSYAGRFAREGFPSLADDPGIRFDTSAVLNPSVFALALDRFGPERLMFGSDFPILYMRGRRRWEGDRYINLTSGDYSWNIDREPPEVEVTYTLFIYEALAACIDACRQLGFGQAALNGVFHDNARRLVDGILTKKAAW